MNHKVSKITQQLKMATDMRNYLPKEMDEELKKWTQDKNHLNYMSDKIKDSQKRIKKADYSECFDQLDNLNEFIDQA